MSTANLQSDYLQSILDSLHEPVLILDRSLNIVAAAEPFYHAFVTTAEATIGRTVYDCDFCTTELHSALKNLVANHEPIVDFELAHTAVSNFGFHMYKVSGRFISSPEGRSDNILLAFQNISERKEIADRLLRVQKMATLGQMAGGVGHELRNPLSSIKSAAYYLNLVLQEDDPEVKDTLDILDREVDTCEKIITSLLDYANARPRTRWKTEIPDIVNNAIKRSRVPENIKIRSIKKPDFPPIPADPVQLSLVFRNIIQNAVESMPHGGFIEIVYDIQDHEWVTISFTDSGDGICEENIERLFEPLFTTKEHGTGLGLAVTRTLVAGHGGNVEVQSTVNKGSCFTIKLPISPETPENTETTDRK